MAGGVVDGCLDGFPDSFAFAVVVEVQSQGLYVGDGFNGLWGIEAIVMKEAAGRVGGLGFLFEAEEIDGGVVAEGKFHTV